jgi:hypothetical protein
VAVCVVVLFAGLRLRERRARKEILRERLASDVDGHRQEADAHASRASELGPQAEANREEAARLTAKAEDLEARAQRARRFANRHGARADERERELEEI